MKEKIKLALLSTLLLGMLFYIGWVFYISEPQYIDNCYKKVEQFDYVSIPESHYSSFGNTYANNDVNNGIVLQVDSTKAIVKVIRWSEEFTEIDLKKHEFRIIGKGTIYHKVNNYVGMNIMLITQVFIGILAAILMYVVSSIVKDYF